MTTGRWDGGRSSRNSRLNSGRTRGAPFCRRGPPPSLPADASSFIGRSRELAELKSLLRDTRLLTLAGTGGVGKTRLALELARAVEPAYPDGAALVELAEVTDALLVPDAIAAALDLRALSGQRVVDALVEYVLPRSLLLVLDNCEHLLPATAGLADTLLRTAPRLTILATSREPLRVPGEVVFRVPSLDIADPEQRQSPHDLERYEAVRLFVARGVAACPGFVLDEENAIDVARICFRSTACRSPSSSPPAAWERSVPRRSRNALTTDSAYSARGACIADTAADAQGHAAVEPRPPRARRAHAIPSPCSLRWGF